MRRFEILQFSLDGVFDYSGLCFWTNIDTEVGIPESGDKQALNKSKSCCVKIEIPQRRGSSTTIGPDKAVNLCAPSHKPV